MNTTSTDVPAEAANATQTGENPIWVNARTAAEAAAISFPRLKKFAAAGKVRVRRLPGCHPRYALQDLLNLDASA